MHHWWTPVAVVEGAPTQRIAPMIPHMLVDPNKQATVLPVTQFAPRTMHVLAMNYTLLDNNHFLCTVYDSIQGHVLWKSDGTSAGTVPVKVLFAGQDPNVTYPSSFIKLGNAVYFQAKSNTGIDIWKTDGTTNGTVQLYQNMSFKLPIILNNNIYFSGYKTNTFPIIPKPAIWKTDGTTLDSIYSVNVASHSLTPALPLSSGSKPSSVRHSSH